MIISGGTVYNATVGDGATVTVTGGTGHAGNWCNDGTLNITDGTFGVVKFYNNSGTIAISGGTFSTLQNFDNTSSLIAPISLLAPGHAFYKDNTVQDGSRGDFLQDVTVKEHTHTMVNNKCACGLSCTHTNAEGAKMCIRDRSWMKYKGVKMMKNEMKLSMDAISENEALGRICIATFLTRLHPTLEELEDVKTAVSEAITNAIIHGVPADGKVYITCRCEKDIFHVEIEDHGVGIADIPKAMEPVSYTHLDVYKRQRYSSCCQSG